jgi:hypothetical protein
MTDWVTIAAFASAASSVVLAGATFSSVRSASRAARAAERSLLVGMRPLLTVSRLDDRTDKVMWVDDHFAKIAGGHGYATIVDDKIYMAVSLRNAGQGLGVLQGWNAIPARLLTDETHAAVADFRRQLRDLYIPAGDVGYWHAAIRDPEDRDYEGLCKAITERTAFTIDLMYSDHEGGQRIISRVTMRPRDGDDSDWITAVGRHWNLDRPDPR